MATWTMDAESYAEHLGDLLVERTRSGDVTDGAPLQQRIDQLRSDLRGASATGDQYSWRDRLLGFPREAAWLKLHDLEEELERLTAGVDVVREDAICHVRRELPAAEAKGWITRIEHAPNDKVRHDLAVEAITRTHELSTARLRTAHSWNHATLLLSGLLVLLAGIAVWAQTLTGDEFIARPDGTSMPAAALLALVMLVGLVGAALTALLTVYTLNRRQTRDIRWFDPRPAQTAVKLATGMWTAVILVWLVGSGVVTGRYTSLSSVLLIALLGGFGQEAVTHLLDHTASGMTIRDGTRSENSKGTP